MEQSQINDLIDDFNGQSIFLIKKFQPFVTEMLTMIEQKLFKMYIDKLEKCYTKRSPCFIDEFVDNIFIKYNCEQEIMDGNVDFFENEIGKKKIEQFDIIRRYWQELDNDTKITTIKTIQLLCIISKNYLQLNIALITKNKEQQ
jgi:hypothetical protein